MYIACAAFELARIQNHFLRPLNLAIKSIELFEPVVEIIQFTTGSNPISKQTRTKDIHDVHLRCTKPGESNSMDTLMNLNCFDLAHFDRHSTYLVVGARRLQKN